MTVKAKQFPLNLSSLVNKHEAKRIADQTSARSAATASRQTAMQNAMQSHRVGVSAKSVLPSTTTPSNSPSRINTSSILPMGVSRPAQATEGIRDAMVKRVAQQGVKDQLVLSALRGVQRHLFIEPGLSGQAYVDASIPIGHHQTISQPYIVARMIEIMRNGGVLQRVLEIGTGCGYQAAVLSLVAKDVYSIERIKALHELAKNNLRPMRIPNIRLHYGDGMLGLPHVAPFDGIILAAAGLEVPQALLDQLAVGGRLIAPVGARNQVLELIERISPHEWRRSVMEQCHFVPLRPGLV